MPNSESQAGMADLGRSPVWSCRWSAAMGGKAQFMAHAPTARRRERTTG